MVSINALFSQTYRVLVGSGAALLLSSAIMTSANAADIAATYDNSCAACHDSGALNAIKKGDSAKWQQLIKQKSMPTLINSVKSGMTQMPAGGLCNSCSDDDYRKLIEYMSK
ncbi:MULTISPECIES: c-type cytochrome [Psychrobacter]|uniref:c-type cytochrome n=1 Tax=Psychrobacter TaxID=497 RepID=UPI000431382A|nr:MULTISPECIES: c-type cytochrome [Psychrobacter]MBE8608287.1 cytochrome c5 family protein [Pseudomonas lundensis]MCG3809047.1 cytochrome c5 family protein [Psychrobacter sp. Ps4]GAF62629.1 cytochrome c [Psychrobacter sp. JCM 18903]HCI74744.1 cytochrome c5 family protein [Psychrobacter sp.]